MKDAVCGTVRSLYKEHSYLINDSVTMLDKPDIERFELIRGESNYPRVEDTLLELSAHLARHHREKCIILIDEYDHPMDVAYRKGYYEEARDFFSALMGKLLKVNIL
jgi:hypothetical protein